MLNDFAGRALLVRLLESQNCKPPLAPLKPIPAIKEPFSQVIIDCIGPLPKTKLGNQYLLTIMCLSTRFPEAIPLRNIKAPSIVKALVRFFTFVGLPKSTRVPTLCLGYSSKLCVNWALSRLNPLLIILSPRELWKGSTRPLKA